MIYLDMARGAIRSGPGRLLNRCWGPAYPALIAASLRAPFSTQTTLAILHAALLIAAMAAFLVFLRRVLANIESGARRSLVLSLCAVFFLWGTMSNTPGVRYPDPDLCTFILIVAAASIVVRMYSRPMTSWWPYVALGVVLGLGYYVKQAMLPVDGLLLAILFALPSHSPRFRSRVVVAAAVFIATCTPFAAWLSSAAGHLTFSENGRLNYLWHVENIPMVPFDASSYRAYLASKPRRTPDVLLSEPLVIGFGDAEGTYPLIYDPARWFEGVQPHFELRRQVRSVIDNCRGTAVYLLSFRAVWLGLLVLFLVRSRDAGSVPVVPARIVLIVWCIATCAALHLVHVEARYLLPFLCILLAIGYASVAHKLESTGFRVLMLTVIAVVAIPNTADIVALKSALHEQIVGGPEYLRIAGELRAQGLKSGGRIAVVGFGSDAYYASVLGAQVAAQIPDEGSFSRLTGAEMDRVRAALLKEGVSFLVVPGKPAGPPSLATGLAQPGTPWRVIRLN